MEACVWLEMYFRSWNPKGILVVVSHSQDFLNGVCTNIITLSNKKLQYYSGNYDQYVQTRMEKEENQMKNYKWEQDQIKHMKDYIARFGHGSAKLARQAKSKEKTLSRMESKGLTEVVRQEKKVLFSFPDCDNLSPPVLVFQSVSFAYPGCPYLYKNLDFGIDLDSRFALVGPTGAGKTSLLKLMVGQSSLSDGQVFPHNKLRIAWYNQHTVDQLDMELSPLRYMRNLYPEEGEETVRGWLGRFGVTGASQTQKMRYLSDGQKSRVVFCYMSRQHPHILLLDEPTNHLDMESIDALADAINDFNGGVVLVSHDMRLILQVADELWVCNNKTITRWEGDIISYKQTLLQEIYAQNLLDGDLANI